MFCSTKSLISHDFYYLFYVQNLTLEHYTTYKASDLKACVQALQELQLNTKGCPLNSIRIKYRQDKVRKNKLKSQFGFLKTISVKFAA